MNAPRRILRDREGAVLVEFALVAPVFVAMLFGMIETGRLFWVKQTLDEVAYSTARCMSVSASCETETQQKTFAVDRAASLGIAITAAEITITGASTCKGVAGSNAVTIRHTDGSPVIGLVPELAQVLEADACFPSLS